MVEHQPTLPSIEQIVAEGYKDLAIKTYVLYGRLYEEVRRQITEDSPNQRTKERYRFALYEAGKRLRNFRQSGRLETLEQDDRYNSALVNRRRITDEHIPGYRIMGALADVLDITNTSKPESVETSVMAASYIVASFFNLDTRLLVDWSDICAIEGPSFSVIIPDTEEKYRKLLFMTDNKRFRSRGLVDHVHEFVHTQQDDTIRMIYDIIQNLPLHENDLKEYGNIIARKREEYIRDSKKKPHTVNPFSDYITADFLKECKAAGLNAEAIRDYFIQYQALGDAITCLREGEATALQTEAFLSSKLNDDLMTPAEKDRYQLISLLSILRELRKPTDHTNYYLVGLGMYQWLLKQHPSQHAAIRQQFLTDKEFHEQVHRTYFNKR